MFNRNYEDYAMVGRNNNIIVYCLLYEWRQCYEISIKSYSECVACR